MTNHPPFYDDEAVLLSWGESPKDGAWIKLQITEDTVPFLRGLKRGSEHGERFTMVLTGPLQNDETVSGPVAQRIEPGVSTAKVAGSNPVGAATIAPVVGVEPGGDSVPSIAAPPGPKPNSTRAVMMAKDPEFWAYVDHCGIAKPTDEASAQQAIKFMCQVQSKTELNERGKASEAFDRMRGNFKAWRLARAHGQLER